MIQHITKEARIEVVAGITGDGRVDDLRRAHGASLNLVQCSGATQDLAKMKASKVPFAAGTLAGAGAGAGIAAGAGNK